MSAESPRRARAGGPLVVVPQPPSDRSLMDAVSGFISDVTLAASPSLEPKDAVLWARFESADVDEPRSESDSEADADSLPLLLVVGYGSGVQVWVIQPGAEAQEVLSWRQGSVRVVRVLPSPTPAGDLYATRRPLLALCDSAGPGAPYCALSFISLVGGEQVKSIKFKNPILDVLANKKSIVVSFAERLAVFDACTLEDRLTVTTCYPAPCPLGGATPSNPVALGDRWLAYAERRLSPTKKSNGGCEGEGVASYTATVLHAAKSLGKGLRGLGESVASSLGGRGGGALSQSPSPPNLEQLQPGVITILDIEGFNSAEDDDPDAMEDSTVSTINDAVVAHFVAHSEPIIALKFDASGMILITADKRGHDFHVFRIHPHPSGPTLASVHHLYILHRGDTTAKVQDISISMDCRWAAVSTLRGTTHVFPITPYGGPAGVRTHATPHVVNRLSRFHRSAGLAADGRSNSPVGENLVNSAWYPNPRLPPFPVPCTQGPLAQLRPLPPAGTIPTNTITRNSSGRQRLSSLSEESQLPLAVCSRWGAVRPPGSAPRGAPGARPSPGATQALYVMSAHGYLVQYYIHPKHIAGIPKEKVCDDTCIELEVEARAQWPLLRPSTSHDILAPLLPNNILIKPSKPIKNSCDKSSLDVEDRWLSQVEIMTHAGPHRRLWMGPQFVFKTYNATSGTSLSLLDSDAVEVGTGPAVARSNPVNMPGARPIVPVLIESGSASSLEHSPRLSDAFRKQSSLASDCNDIGGRGGGGGGVTEGRLKEDLAEAMKETEQGCEWTIEDRRGEGHVRRIVNPLGAVVAGAPGSPSSPPQEDEPHILSNEDEALFRPVVSAPRSLPAPRAPPTRPLSSALRLPAGWGQLAPCTPPAPAAALHDRVVIPASLTPHDPAVALCNHSGTDVQSKSRVIVDRCSPGKSETVKTIETVSEELDTKEAPLKVDPVEPMKRKNKEKKNSKSKSSGRSDQKKVQPDESKYNVDASKVPSDELKYNMHTKKVKSEDFTRDIEVKEFQSDDLMYDSGTRKVLSENLKYSVAMKKDLVDNLRSNEKNIIDTEISEARVSQTYFDEISKAVDSMEIFNDEIVENNLNRISSYDWAKSSKSSETSCDATLNFIMDEICSDEMVKETIAIKEKVSQITNKSDIYAPLKNISEKGSGWKVNPEEESAWEMLSDLHRSKTGKNEECLRNFEIDNAAANFVVPEVKDSINVESGKLKKRKTKLFKPKGITGFKTEISELNSNTQAVVEDVDIDFDMPEDTPKLSWSAVASSKNRKSAEKECVDVPALINENPYSAPRDDDNSLASKLSTVCNKKNIVVALCDTPQSELCFVDEHHSVFIEPPPLEPLDLVLDEQKIQEMHDSLLDYSQRPVNLTIATSADSSDRSLSLTKSDASRNIDDFIGTSDYNLPNTKHYEEELEDIGLEHTECSRSKVMEKSSDEDNNSPSSSQTESDDCSNMLASDMKYTLAGESSLVADEPLALVPPSANKTNKKKPKRKRR